MPNANGQYRRQTVQEARPAPVPPEREAAPKREEPHAEKCEPQREQPPVRKDCPSNEQSPACRQVQTGLLRGLFPGIDSGDLLLLALLLLLLTEGSEDAAPIVLTLALALLL